MASTKGFLPSHLPPISDTGMQGYLKWFRREQPNLYAKVAPQIYATFPRVFSDYTQTRVQGVRDAASRATLARRLRMRGGMTAIMGALVGEGAMDGRLPVPRPYGLGQNDSSVVDQSYIDLLQNSPDPDIVSTFQTPTVDTGSFAAPNIDIADAANSTGGTGTADATAIAAIATGAAQLYTTSQQMATAQSINNLQIQRAQQGLAPLNIGMNANGVPTITGVGLTGSAGTVLLLVGGGLLLLMMMGGKKAA